MDAPVLEPSFETNDHLDIVVDKSIEEYYDAVIGWAFDREMLTIFGELEGVDAKAMYEAGGLHSLEEDQEVIDSVDGDILFYVKAWEPPTMDFIDFLTALSQKKSRVITLYPLGTVEQDYRAADDAFEIWAQKVDKLKAANIRMKR